MLSFLEFTKQLKDILVRHLMPKLRWKCIERMQKTVDSERLQWLTNVNLWNEIRWNRLNIHFTWTPPKDKLTAPGIVASKLHVLNSVKGFVFIFWQTRTLSLAYFFRSFEFTTCNLPLSLFLMLLGQIRSVCSGRCFSENIKAASMLLKSSGLNFLIKFANTCRSF